MGTRTPARREPNPRLVVVDDVEDGRLVLDGMLRGAGYDDVVLLASAEEVFAYFGLEGRPSAQHVDVVLLDVSMPRIDGIEVCRRIKAEPVLADVPVVMVTAHAEEETLARAFAAGASDFITKPVRALELVARVRSALGLKREMDRRRANENELGELARWLEEANSSLRLLTTLDPLTGIANRRHFDTTLVAEVRRAQRDRVPISVAMIDVDHFKRFNDTWGHPAGDACLRRVARAVCGASRRPSDFVARYGGEELAVVLPDTDRDGALLVAERMRAAVSASGSAGAGRKSPPVTISVGVATAAPSHAYDVSDLVSAADRALYEAKRGGRDTVRFEEVELPSVPRHTTPRALATPRAARKTQRRAVALPAAQAWIAERIPRFVSNRVRDVRLLKLASARGDFETVQRVGQNLRAVGQAHELAALASLGLALTEAARAEDAAAVRDGTASLAEMVRGLRADGKGAR